MATNSGFPVPVDFTRQVEHTVRRHDMFPKGTAVLAGVSGGPDSVALARVLMTLAEKYGFDLGIAHLNHCLRARESDRDADFVKRLAQRFSLPFFYEQLDVADLGHTSGTSLEEAGRNARYDFFSRTVKAHGFGRIALGHTWDDNAEQVLMGLLRGAGPKGLGGIPATRDDIVRPLIRCSRERVLAFLGELGQAYCLDSSNRDTAFLRNRVRHQLIPFLETTFNPGIKSGLNRLSDILRAEDDFVAQQADQAMNRCLTEKTKNALSLDIQPLKNGHPALVMRILRKAIEAVKTDLRRITHAHIRAVHDLAIKGEAGKHLDLPDRIRVYRLGQTLRIQKETSPLRQLGQREKQARGPS